jgi:signal transduction histidine kinase
MNPPPVDPLQAELDEAARDVIRLEQQLVEVRMEVKRREKTFRCIQQLYHELSTAKDCQSIYLTTVKSLAEKVGFDRTLIFKLQDQFMPIAFWGYSEDSIADSRLESVNDPAFMTLVCDRQPLLINGKTLSQNPDLEALHKSLQSELQVRYLIAIPFGVQDSVNHILCVGNQTEDTLRRTPLTAADVEMLQTLANQIANVIQQLELYDRAQAAAKQAQTHALQLERSMSELQSAQLQLIQSEKMSALGNLVAGVAHEINNPVSFINGNINFAHQYVQDLIQHLALYQSEYSPSEAIQKSAKKIELDYLIEDLPKLLSSMKVGTERIQQISVSLRTFSRADRTDKVRFNLHEGLESTLLILKHRLKANEQRPEIMITKSYRDLPEISCYPGQLSQVFMNIIANAIDAFDEQNQTRSYEEIEASPNAIYISSSTIDASQVLVSIRDNGSGIPEELRQKIFEHLFTTKAVGKGTGLGLSISRQIVTEGHAGQLECQSTPGQGTEFLIYLPI